MAKYIDAEKLKSIIKVQIKERKEWMKDIDKSDRQDQLWSELNGEDMRILQTINSLQQEQPEESIPNDLVEASMNYQHKIADESDVDDNGHPIIGIFEISDAYEAGAKWQEEKEKEYSPWLVIPKLKEAALEFGERAKDYEIGGQSFAEDMAIAFTRGAEWQKEQMMKEAVKWLKETGANNLYISMFQRDMEGKK